MACAKLYIIRSAVFSSKCTGPARGAYSTRSFSLIPGRRGGAVPPRCVRVNPIGIECPHWIFHLARRPFGPGGELGTVAPGVLPSRQRRCSVDRWRSPGARSGEGNLPATENDQCATVPPSCTGPWSSHVAYGTPTGPLTGLRELISEEVRKGWNAKGRRKGGGEGKTVKKGG